LSTLVAIPAYRIGCRVAIDKARPWSVVDEALIWAAHQGPVTISALASRASLPRQLVVASLARMMRFRLIEAVIDGQGQAGFRTSAYGAELLTSGLSLPYFPKRSSRRISITFDRATGHLYWTREARPWSTSKLDGERKAGADVRFVSVDGAPPMSHEANVARLYAMVERTPDEQLAFIDAHTSSVREDEYLVVRVVDGVLHGLPPSAPEALRAVAQAAAGGATGVPAAPVTYAGSSEDGAPRTVQCEASASDLVVGGDAHRSCVLEMLRRAEHRVILHSTFVRDDCLALLFDAFRDACARDVSIDILWGAASDERTIARYEHEAVRMANRALADPVTRGRLVVHTQPTASHAKAILADGPDGRWCAALGSCNWLSSPFRSIEVSVILRDPGVVAEVARAMQRIVGRRAGLAHPVANDLALLALDLRRPASADAPAEATILIGEDHDARIRQASGTAVRRLVIGSHRLGSTARPGAVLPGAAASKGGAKVHLLYTRSSGPLKDRDARELAAAAAKEGVQITQMTVPLHAKFVAWDDDDVLITSFNWASADSDPNDPFGELGVHVHARGIAKELLARITALAPGVALP
jgi:cardiolipin synthase A/B